MALSAAASLPRVCRWHLGLALHVEHVVADLECQADALGIAFEPGKAVVALAGAAAPDARWPGSCPGLVDVQVLQLRQIDLAAGRGMSRAWPLPYPREPLACASSAIIRRPEARLTHSSSSSHSTRKPGSAGRHR